MLSKHPTFSYPKQPLTISKATTKRLKRQAVSQPKAISQRAKRTVSQRSDLAAEGDLITTNSLVCPLLVVLRENF
jgi:hypothetical protein